MSKLIATKAEFQEMAEKRLVEAKALLDLEMWDGAYYLAGYAVELALKACIIKMLMEKDAFPEVDFSKNCYTHKLMDLVKLADLEVPRQAATVADQDLLDNWAIVREWKETKRYHRIESTTQKCFTRQLQMPYTEYSHGSKLTIIRTNR